MAPSRYDWKIVDWDVKPQHNQPASENDHSNFHIYTLTLPAGSLAVIKRGVYKSSLFIFHRELYSILSDLSLTSRI